MSSPEAAAWWYRTLGTEFGPVEKSTLEKLVADGTLGPDDWVRFGPDGPWRRLDRMAEFFDRGVSRPDHGEAETGVGRRDGPAAGSPARDEGSPLGKDTMAAPDSACSHQESPFPADGNASAHPPASDGSGAPLSPEVDGSGLSGREEPSAELRRTLAEAYVYVRQRHGKAVRPKHSPGRSWSGLVGTAVGGVVRPLGVAVMALGDAAVTVVGWGARSAGWVVPVVRSPIAWGLVVLGAAVWAGFWWEQHRYSETAVFAELQQLAQELRALRQRGADEAEWKRFQKDAHARLQAILAQLQAHSRVEDRVSLDLLWAARDYLPAMLRDARDGPSESERRFQERMAHVEHIWRYERPPAQTLVERLQPGDWLLASLLILDGLLLAAGVFWWWRHRQRRRPAV